MRAGEDETLFAIVDQGGALGSVEPELWKDFSEWYSKGPDFDFFQERAHLIPLLVYSSKLYRKITG